MTWFGLCGSGGSPRSTWHGAWHSFSLSLCSLPSISSSPLTLGRTLPVPKLKDQQADLVTLVYRGPGSWLKVSEAVTGRARLGSTASAARSPPHALSPRQGPVLKQLCVSIHTGLHWENVRRQTKQQHQVCISPVSEFFLSSFSLADRVVCQAPSDDGLGFLRILANSTSSKSFHEPRQTLSPGPGSPAGPAQSQAPGPRQPQPQRELTQ